VGPRAFETGERLYGRDFEVLRLFDLLTSERIVLFYSPSGAGKTSLIQAALVPTLKAAGFDVLPIMRVNRDPSGTDAVHPVASNRYVRSCLHYLGETLAADAGASGAEADRELASYLEGRPKPDDGPDLEVLIFDQFEEILTVDPTDRDAKSEFFAQVGD